MRSKAIAAVATRLVSVAIFVGGSGRAGGETPKAQERTKGNYTVTAKSSLAGVIAEADGVLLTAITQAELQMATRLLSVRGEGDGRGGDVASFFAIQDRFLDSACEFPQACGGPCNVVLVFWTENSPNADGVDVFLDGQKLGTRSGLDPANLPGLNGVGIRSVDARQHTFRAEAVGQASFGEATFNVLDHQPFKDVAGLKCEAGNANGNGNCDVLASWQNTEPVPANHLVIVDGRAVGMVPGTSALVIIPNQPPGDHTVTIAGVTLTGTDGNAFYRGCFIDTTCTITCDANACKAPVAVLLCQAEYGPGATDDTVRASWVNGESPYGVGVNLFVDGLAAGSFATDPQNGTANAALIPQLAPGSHRVGVQGDCGPPSGVSQTTEGTIELLTSSPHLSPVTDDVTCTYDAAKSEMTATWTNDDPSAFIDVFVQSGADLLYVTTIPGDRTTVSVGPTAAADIIFLQFYARLVSGCYGSRLISCTTPPPPGNVYIEGLCNGLGASPQISSAVFGLNFLFIGGPHPPCAKACDANGDGAFNLSDMVYVLSYLFLGGPAPPLWLDSNGDNTKDATCTRAAPTDDCEASHEACAG